jgi:hypothetical protein
VSVNIGYTKLGRFLSKSEEKKNMMIFEMEECRAEKNWAQLKK